MKALASGILAIFVCLFVFTTFVPYPPALARAEIYFTPAQIEQGLAYSFQRRLLFWASTFVELGLLLTLGLGSWGRRLADACLRRLHGSWLASVLAVAGLCAFLQSVLAFPFSVAGFYLARSWGLTARDFVPWLGDYLLYLAIELILGGLALAGLYLLLRYCPRWWTVLATLGAAALAAVVTFLLPLVIAPLFNTFAPLEQTEWADQAPGLYRLTLEAGVPVQAILVMDASRQGSHTNAYFTGLGGSRRIVLYDTLLRKHTPAEVRSILAHELGHWLHHHIYQGIVLGMLGTFVGLVALDRILRRLRGRAPWRLGGLADPAGVPLVLLLGYLGFWVVRPIENAVSRHFERQADATSLELARPPEVFVAAEKKLAVDNISNVAPTPWNEWLFSTHPSAVERIDMGERWGER